MNLALRETGSPLRILIGFAEIDRGTETKGT